MSKTYFLAPTRDSPPNGPIFLGSIIKSPRSPEITLNGKKSPILKTLEILETSLSNSTRQLSKTSNGKSGVWAEFIDGMGIGGEISGNWDNSEIATYKFDELITRTIAPDLEEVDLMFKEPSIQKAIKDSRFRDNLYMITGIKIARGADVAIEKIRSRGGNLHFGIDATPAGVPLKVGPDITVSKGSSQGLTERHTNDFVFAYRLREIAYVRKEVREQKEYVKGDLMGTDGKEREEEAENDGSKDEAQLSGLRKTDVQADAWDLDTVPTVDDDGEEVVCVLFEEDD